MDLINLIKKYGEYIPSHRNFSNSKNQYMLVLNDNEYIGVKNTLFYDEEYGIILTSYWGYFSLYNNNTLIINENKIKVHNGNNSVQNQMNLFINMAQKSINKLLLKENLENNLPLKNTKEKINKI